MDSVEEMAFKALEKSDELLAILADCDDATAWSAVVTLMVGLSVRPSGRYTGQPRDIKFLMDATSRLDSAVLRGYAAATGAIDTCARLGRTEYLRQLEEHRAPLYRARRASGA